MDPENIIKQLKNNQLDQQMKELVLIRTIPLPDKNYFEALYLLMEDESLKDKAEMLFSNISIEEAENYLREKKLMYGCATSLYERFKNDFKRKVKKAIIDNLAMPEDVLIDIAKSDDEELLELLSIKEIKIIAHPKLLEILMNNPLLKKDRKFRLREIKERFLEWTPEQKIEEKKEEEEEQSIEIENEEEKVTVEMEETGEIKVVTLSAIKNMNIGDKVKLGLFGNQMIRKYLIKDPNRIVREAVMQSPKITENEIESFIKQRMVSEDVIRAITNENKWIAKYSIVLSLIQNPKTPVKFSITYLSKLILKDLKMVSNNRDVPAPVRKKAKKLVSMKLGG